MSARTYSAPQHRIFILLQQENKYYPVIYDLTRKQFEKRTEIEVLDLIACTENLTCDALIKPAKIEHYANEVVKKWCEQKVILVEEVLKICTIYLEPAAKRQNTESFFTDSIP